MQKPRYLPYKVSVLSYQTITAHDVLTKYFQHLPTSVSTNADDVRDQTKHANDDAIPSYFHFMLFLRLHWMEAWIILSSFTR